MILACVDVGAKELLHSALNKYAQQKDYNMQEKQGTAVFTSPDQLISGGTIPVLTPASTDSVDEVVVVGDDDDGYLSDDEQSIRSTTDEFLAELKEEVVLQTLLHKRIHEKKERVFQLEHRNGRRLLVVLPPDTQSVASFEEEARRTGWVDIMLNTRDRVEGMLSYLAKGYADAFIATGKRRQLSTRIVALSTTETLALARVGRLNDARLQSIRSFLKNIDKVNLQLSKKEQPTTHRQSCGSLSN
jgi:hypothetical protein